MKNQNKKTPVYRVAKSWEYNYERGPNFKGPYPRRPKEKKWQFLGHKLISPLGVAAGPLPNAKWMIPYLRLGYGSIVQKTVRSSAHKSHPAPNITFVEKGQRLKLDRKPLVVGLAVNNSVDKLSITNSFGNPCKEPKEWMAEGKKAKKAARPGQLFGISVYGTSSEGTTLAELAWDYAKTAKMAKTAGAQFIEANLACPNVSGAENPFLYKDAKAVAKIAKEIKKAIGKTPLVLKIGYFEKYRDLLFVLKSAAGNFEAVSAINTMQKKVVDKKGKLVLPGREVSGICGQMIKIYGIQTVKNLKKAQKELNLNFEIIGVGGVMQPKDVVDYLKAGANHVHSATAVMFNPYLAYDLQLYLAKSR